MFGFGSIIEMVMLFGIKFSVLIWYWANGFGFHWQVGFLRSGYCYQSGLGLVQFGFGSWAMTSSSLSNSRADGSWPLAA